MKKYPIILAIDTSCDDTSVAVTQGMRVLSNIIASQEEIHRKFGGVMPLMAKLAHHDLINPTYKEAIKRARINPKQIDAIAVTKGPGLAIALEVGIEFAKELNSELKKPIIPINHMLGHLYSVLAVNSNKNHKPNLKKDDFPIISLLVSGGHSDLILLESESEIISVKKIGQTIDDAAGESLDKFARLIDLGYPGAAAMEKVAEKGDKTKYQFPIPMMQSQDFNYSFSGLKTAGRHQIEKLKNKSKKDIEDLAASFQQAVFNALIYKLNKAVDKFHPKSIWLGGGVSSNTTFRKILKKYAQEKNIKFKYPTLKKTTTDNAAMIGIAAYFEFQKNNVLETPNQINSLQREPRLSI